MRARRRWFSPAITSIRDEAGGALSRLHGSLIAVLGLAAVAALVTGVSSTGAAESCPVPVTASDGGSVVYISPCAGEVEVTSPLVTTIYGSSAGERIEAGPNVEMIFAGDGADVIYAGPETELIAGEDGNDEIHGEPLEVENPAGAGNEPSVEDAYPRATRRVIAVAKKRSRRYLPAAGAQISTTCSSNPCLGGLGNQQLYGGGGADQIFGERGNDELFGGSGPDSLYGGIGDDTLHGQEGNDLVAGGGGDDGVYGDEDNDLVRGDTTGDSIYGGLGTDTVSFSTGVTPGFQGEYPSQYVTDVAGFPKSTDGEGRGVYVRLDGGGTTCGLPACNNEATLGGGSDDVVSGIENIIGTAFADLIVGSTGANKIYGGGGGDVIIGRGGADELFGGPDGDYLENESAGAAYGGVGANNCVGIVSPHECAGSEAVVTQPASGSMSAGVMAVTSSGPSYYAVYLVGSSSADEVAAHYDEASKTVTFTSYGPTTTFSGEPEGCVYESGNTVASCPLPGSSPELDAVVLAGMNGNDHLTVSGSPKFPLTSTPILLGGQGGDSLGGGSETEDVLIDGNNSGADTLQGYGHDDMLLNNSGADVLEGGNGNDLLLSTTTCDGDTLRGGSAAESDGSAQNDASWAKLPGPGGVTADIEAGLAGNYWNSSTSKPACSSGSTSGLFGIDDLEGSSQGDALFGGTSANLLLGRSGQDNLQGRAGDDRLEANDGAKDTVGGGADNDTCLVDLPTDVEITGCEDPKPSTGTTTTMAQPTTTNGTPGTAVVKGNVAANGSLSGYRVRVLYSKEESGKWVLKVYPEPVLPENGNFTNTQGVGVGNWRVKTVFFTPQNPYQGSETSYKYFTIKSK